MPKQLGYKSVKWVERIELSEKIKTGYWESNGYPEDAPVSGILSLRAEVCASPLSTTNGTSKHPMVLLDVRLGGAPAIGTTPTLGGRASVGAGRAARAPVAGRRMVHSAAPFPWATGFGGCCARAPSARAAFDRPAR